MDPDMMGQEGAGEGGEGAAPMPADPGAKEPGNMEQGGVIHIPQDMLPPGMAQKIKKDDILEFRCIGPADAEGDVPVEYNTGEGEEEKEEPWEDQFRKEMSPRSTAGDEGASDGGGAGQGY